LLQTTLNDPLVGKIATVIFGMIVINLLVCFVQGLTSGSVESSDRRYVIQYRLPFLDILPLFS
jgi:hypothetical protein